MNYKDFNRLDKKDKGEKTFLQGKYISARDYYNKRLILYSLDDFFVEVWYMPTNNKVHKMEGINGNDKRIDRYIDQEVKK